tara:strand:+ start:770 stop:1789 length:1020 start_codon:yes stop_codon:yes gene_type:complete
MSQIIDYIEKINDKEGLSILESYNAFMSIMSGNCVDSDISNFLISLKEKGESINEIIGAVRAIREKMITVKVPDDTIDIVGTGGDGYKTLNISTATALLAASNGIKVAKHGNRSVSSLSGSSDVLSALGININLKPNSCVECLNETNICFLFAPLFHGSFKHVAKVRAELKTRTIFNILGPLCNPGNVKKHLIGTYDRTLLHPMIEVLKSLGSESAWLVHSNDGLDEISISDKTFIYKLDNDRISEEILEINDIDIKPAKISEIVGGDANYNANELIKVFKGEKNPYREIITLNSAAALTMCGFSNNIEDAISISKESIDSGKALQTLENLIKVSKKLE